jgi:predicted RNA-binding Zn ribbon-like protein
VSSTPIEWLGDAEAKPAPGLLQRIQALVNTVDMESGPDPLANIGEAAAWLIAKDLIAPDAAPTADDLVVIRAVREALRAMLVHNAGGPAPTTEALAPLRAIAATNEARAAVDDDGAVRIGTTGESVQARLFGLVLIVRDSQLAGTWSRLKACGNDACRWAFYDGSRNHGGTWCAMATCGNKLKNRDFRARKRAGGTQS